MNLRDHKDLILPGLCIFGAIIVAATGHDGWGWLLFMAVVLL